MEMMPFTAFDTVGSSVRIHFTIDAEVIDGQVVITITDTTRRNRAEALRVIRAEGFNPDDFEIVHVDVSEGEDD